MDSGVLMKAMPATATDPRANVLLQGSLRADCGIDRERRGGVGIGGDPDARRFPQASPDEERVGREMY